MNEEAKVESVEAPVVEKKAKMGLRQRIAAATTVAEIDSLLAEGSKYDQASIDTRRSWQKTAARRRKELTK